ncbi:uncharacterized protein BT62DRAFT_1080933 [Guyanagaster necrorhizus]|uniref:Uncharacterized protein n=1 Tax=Guyanagaster necrorhizus TaxID=856835 RepID=A0A9P7VGU2_9AGAR|nr:uncharacterized protein BT62DRAFT_1080933 [Guyanagaster necrorhizus MCA 3950]KAG7440312.1 hypothetical protein BT62DRAFT_1080933 [Guyanagaster necrorhizus MCA 3950]
MGIETIAGLRHYKCLDPPVIDRWLKATTSICLRKFGVFARVERQLNGHNVTPVRDDGVGMSSLKEVAHYVAFWNQKLEWVLRQVENGRNSVRRYIVDCGNESARFSRASVSSDYVCWGAKETTEWCAKSAKGADTVDNNNVPIASRFDATATWSAYRLTWRGLMRAIRLCLAQR